MSYCAGFDVTVCKETDQVRRVEMFIKTGAGNRISRRLLAKKLDIESTRNFLKSSKTVVILVCTVK